MDLAVLNINRMIREWKSRPVTCWGDPSDHTLSNITEMDFAPVRHLFFLEAFADAYNQVTQAVQNPAMLYRRCLVEACHR